MSLLRKIKIRAQRRALRTRKKFKGDVYRISVFRSLNHIYAQIIDDTLNNTIVSCSSLELQPKKKDGKKTTAHAVGYELAQRAVKKGITVAAFDRGNKLFHGRIKSLAEGLKEGGITL